MRDNGKTLNIGISEDTKESRIEHMNDDEIRRRKNKEELLHSKGINNLLFSIEEIHKIYPNINEFDLCDLILNDKYYNINYKSTTAGDFVIITCSDDRIISIKVSRNMSYEWDYFSREKYNISEWVDINVIYFISNKDNLIFRALNRLDTNENLEIYYDSQDDNLHLKKIGWDLIPINMPYLSLDYIASKQLNMDVEINKILEFINNNTLSNITIDNLNDSIDRIKKMYEENSDNGIIKMLDVSDDSKKIADFINENSLSEEATKRLNDVVKRLNNEVKKQQNEKCSNVIPDIEKITKIKEGALNVSKSFSDEELNALACFLLQSLEDKLSNKQLEKYYN